MKYNVDIINKLENLGWVVDDTGGGVLNAYKNYFSLVAEKEIMVTIGDEVALITQDLDGDKVIEGVYINYEKYRDEGNVIDYDGYAWETQQVIIEYPSVEEGVVVLPLGEQHFSQTILNEIKQAMSILEVR